MMALFGLLWRLGTSGRNGKTVDQVRDLCETARIELEGAQERDDYPYNGDNEDDDDDVKHFVSTSSPYLVF